MNRTISISLAGQLFHVEEDAYRVLEAYLQAVRSHFAAYPDKEEIITDIESRMAEQFAAKMDASSRVVNRADIDEVIKTMGTIEDFKAFEQEGSTPPAADTAKRKLYRDPDDKILGGVASGLAAYFGIDVTLVRIIFVLTLFAGGTGIIAYIILWLIVPEAQTPSQKMAMRGKALTISELEKKFRETIQPAAEQVKKNETLKQVAAAPFRFISRLFDVLIDLAGKLIQIFGKVAGLFISIVAGLGLFALTFGFVSLLVNMNSPYVDFPWRDIMDQTIFYVLAASAFVAVFVPLQFVLLAGSSLLSGKSKFRTPVIAGLTALWFAALLIGGATALRYVPEYAQKWNEQETTRVEQVKTFEVTEFSRMDFSNGYRVTVRQGETLSVTASGDERDLESLTLLVQDGTLRAQREGQDFRLCLFCVRRGLQINVTTPAAEELTLSGGSRGTVQGFTQDSMSIQLINGSRLEMASAINTLTANVSGGSSLFYEGNAAKLVTDVANGSRAEFTGQYATLTAQISGASRMELVGSGETLTAEVTNGSRLEAVEYAANNVTLMITGASRAEVDARTSLKADVSNSSVLVYVDNGVTPDTSVSGSSRVQKQPASIIR